MKKQLLLILFAIAFSTSFAQIMPVSREPYGGNKRAWIGENLGIVKIDISYNRPGVKGREGKIYGTGVAHYGFVDLGHGTTNAAPWRAGANENTTISFSHPVKIEGKDLPAGKYGFFIALGETESKLIFSKNNSSWGSFYYDETQDALRVSVKHQNLAESVEWLKYDLSDETENSVTISMSWEKRRFAFKVEADTKALQMEEFRNSFKTTRIYYDILVGVYWCVENNYELEQALAWADRAVSMRVMGEKNFRTLQAKSMVLNKMGRTDEAKTIMLEAIPMGTPIEVHSYGRQLLNQKMTQDAFKIFKMNYDKHPENYYTHVGLGRAYSAMGEYKKALALMKSAIERVGTDAAAKANITAMIEKLEKGQDVN
jgi:hypothetical protein